jgi:hypothetical protein
MSSANMVKMKKQGCPMDSVESVEAWRKLHQNIAQRKPDVKQPKPAASPPAPIAPFAQAEPAHDFGRVGGDDFHAMIRANQVQYDGSPLGEGFDEAKIRHKIAEANLAELEEARIKGLHVEKTKVDAAFFEAARGLRDGMTNCSRRLAAEVATLTTPAECESVIAKELRHLLESFTRQLAQKMNTPIIEDVQP